MRAAIAEVEFVASDGSRSVRLLEGTAERSDRAGLGVGALAELLAADRGAVSFEVREWKGVPA